MIREAVKRLFNLAGLEVHRLVKDPRRTLLGLKSLPIRSVIDVGANNGQFARYIHGIFPDAQLLCFEPLPEAFKQLSAWASTLPVNQARVFQRALGEEEGTVRMYHHTGHDASSSLLATTPLAASLYPQLQAQALAEVRQTILDKVLAGMDMPLIDDILIKLDVQGYEDRVIRGGRHSFSRARACIAEINLDGLYQHQAGFVEIQHLLTELGYRYAGNLEQSYDEDGHVIYIDAVFVRAAGG